ncbi:MAG: hypothetical protein KJ063_15490 [Anaerolineae bacterium]|nr:hypothetical protein [Anaerolineae bacterium]
MGTVAEELIQQGMQQGIQQGMQQGMQQGQEQGLRQAILDLLAIRFDLVSPQLSSRLQQIKSLDTLRQLLREAAVVDKATSFQQFLANLE